MKRGQRLGDLRSAYVATRMYEEVGFGNRDSIKNRLLASIEKTEKEGDKKLVLYYTPQIEAYFLRNPSPKKDLEKKIASITAIFSLTIATYLLSKNLTGYSIVNVDQTIFPTAFIIILAILGLIVFLIAKNK